MVMDDLEVNPLYKAFLTKFRKQLELACELLCLIAIPHSDSLEDLRINSFMINSHILMPSKLLKMHFTPLQVGYCDDIEIEDKKLLVTINNNRDFKRRIVINILGEDLGYSSANKAYKIIIIDRPLLPLGSRPLIKSIASPHSLMITWQSPRSSQQRSTMRMVKPPSPLIDHDDCFKYLDFISQSLTMDLEIDVKRLQSTYMILSDFLSDAAEKIESLVNVYVPKFKKQLEAKAKVRIEDNISLAICLSVENYVLHLMHGKLMASIFHRYDKEDKIFLQKLDLISKAKLTVSQLGAQSVYANFILSEDTINNLNSLTYLQSPLAIVSAITQLINLLSDGLNQSVECRYLMGDGLSCPLNESIAICSDDLIATMVFALIRAKPSGLFSVSKFIELFGWTASAKDQAAYNTATFQISVQYVFNYQNNETEPIDNKR